MITEEHLAHWVEQTRIRLDAMATELDPKKVVMEGINVGSSGEAWVSFMYLREKIELIRGFMRCIEDDVARD